MARVASRGGLANGDTTAMTLQAKLLLTFGLILSMLLAAGLLGLRQLGDELRERIGEEKRRLAVAILERIEGSFYARVETVRELASTDATVRESVRRASDDGATVAPDELQRRIDDLDAAWRGWRDSGADPPPVVLEVMENPAAELLRAKLNFFERETGYAVFGELFVTDRFGANVAATGITSDYRQDDEGWWQGARRNGVWLGPVAFDDSSAVYSADIAVAVADSQAFLGVLKAVLDIQEVYTALEAFRAPVEADGGALELWADDGAFLYPELSPPGERPPPEAQLTVGGHSGWWEENGVDGEAQVLAAAVSKSHPLYPDLGWTVILRYPTMSLFTPVRDLRRRFLVGAVILFGVAGAMAIVLALSVSRPLAQAVAVAEKLADGDLRGAVPAVRGGEVGRLMTAMSAVLENLGRTLGHLVAASAHVQGVAAELAQTGDGIVSGAARQSEAATAAATRVREMGTSIERVAAASDRVDGEVGDASVAIEELTTAITTVAGTAERLAAAVEETSSAVHQLAGSVERVAANAASAGESSAAAVEEARAGGEIVQQAAQGLEELAAMIEEIVEVHGRLAASSSRITRITGAIEGLAGQTHLLALNAAIEAAHAGERGRGFAIVAEEVQRLAESSASSAKEISSLVEAVERDAERATHITVGGAERAARGRQLSGQAAEALARVVETITTVSEKMLDISRVTAGQATSADQMVATVDQMRQMTIETRRATEEQAAGSSRLQSAMGSLVGSSSEVTAAVERHRREGRALGELIETLTAIAEENLDTASEIGRITRELKEEAAALRHLSDVFVLAEGVERRKR